MTRPGTEWMMADDKTKPVDRTKMLRCRAYQMNLPNHNCSDGM